MQNLLNVVRINAGVTAQLFMTEMMFLCHVLNRPRRWLSCTGCVGPRECVCTDVQDVYRWWGSVNELLNIRLTIDLCHVLASDSHNEPSAGLLAVLYFAQSPLCFTVVHPASLCTADSAGWRFAISQETTPVMQCCNCVTVWMMNGWRLWYNTSLSAGSCLQESVRNRCRHFCPV